MSRERVLSDAQWERIVPLMPSSDGQRGRPFRDHRQVVEGIIYRLRTGIAWRDLPRSFGPHQTVSKRHRRFCADGTWDKIHARLVAEADAEGDVDWQVSVDSTINRAHQHATTLGRVERPAGLTGG
jgi:Transposase and inactivated derivatives